MINPGCCLSGVQRGEISHHVFAELPALLRPADLMVFNNTKVFPARLLGHRLGLASQSYPTDKTPSATIEVLLLKALGDDVWEVLVKPGRKMRVGERVRFGSRLECEVVDRGELGSRRVKFSYQGNFDDLIDTLGHVPLPPYIDRPDQARDKSRYQTIFARKRGAVAAPTAGLHFTPAILRRLRDRGVETCEITLHVGLGTFQPVHADQVEDHQMEAECFEIAADVAQVIHAAKAQNRRVIGVGTTAARALETSAGSPWWNRPSRNGRDSSLYLSRIQVFLSGWLIDEFSLAQIDTADASLRFCRP